MSQVRRQGSDGGQQPLKLPLSSAARTQIPPLSSLTGNLIPRDYLGPRSDGQSFRSGRAGPRTPTSSPLLTNFQPQSHRGDDIEHSQSPLSPKSIVNPAFQTRNQSSQVVHARSLTAPSRTGQISSDMSSGTAEKEPLGGHHQHTRDTAQSPDYNKPRKSSDAVHANHPVTASTSSPGGSPQSISGSRPEQGFIMPRTSSIDSAISSLSSASHSHKSSFDANTLSPSNINNLINAAGSAEAVIVHLLKEKHHAASQNSQLWRLVDKQRTLILGLNKDLERALKEKEKYKKRVRELQSSVPPLPVSDSQAFQSRPADNNDGSGNHRQRQLQNQAVFSKIHKIRSQSSDRATDTGSRNEAEDVDVSAEFEPLHTRTGSFPQLSSNAPDSPYSAVNNDEVAADSAHAEGLVQCSDRQNSKPEAFSQRTCSAASFKSPANDSLDTKDNHGIMPPPNRKPPPAPLNLRRTELSNAEDAKSYDSDSEYDDILEVEGLPLVKRGRRKTREDDDRECEATLAREQETRSLSKKKKSNLLKTGDPDNLHDSAVPAGLPSSPRQTVRMSPAFTESESLGSVLNSHMTRAAPFGDRLVLPPPKSPGLPLSPRPEDRPIGSPLPRMPREATNTLTVPSTSNGVLGLAPSPRGAKFQIPLSPVPPASLATNTNGSRPSPISADLANGPVPLIDATIKIDSPKPSHATHSGIYQGLVSDDYPNLLLPPNALPLIEVKVSSSRLRPSRNSYMGFKPSDEEPVFTLSVFSRSENSELWRVEKVIAALPQLDQQIRQLSNFTGKLPDRSIFSGHSPAKVDARRAALNSYFDALLDTPMDEQAALVICQFLTSDAIEPRDDETSLVKGNSHVKLQILRGPDGKPKKEGYLTKRGKNFGGWKARYFVLHGPELKYYESPGGPHLGTIKIYNAQIGKQSQNTSVRNSSPSRGDDDADNHYRHAFLILEPKKKDSSALVRHVLCAESDEERDAWVEALLEYVESHSSENEGSSKALLKNQSPTQGKHTSNTSAKSKLFTNGNKGSGKGTDNAEFDASDTVQGFSYDDAVPAEPPVIGTPHDRHAPKSSQTLSGSSVESADTNPAQSTTLEHGQHTSHPSMVISGPTNGAVIQDAGAWGNKATKEKKRSIWGFRTRSSVDLASQVQPNHDPLTNPAHNGSLAERQGPVRPVFGIPLAEAVQFCAPQGVDVELPAVVYRCIEYLQAKGAASEEGIFRLSGSNVVVKALKERFNTEGDIDFLAGDQYYDVHAVASLFKQYLRELPTTVLTRELHLDFLRVLELDGRQKKIVAFNSLVHKLPRPNLMLLRALAQFLIVIVNNSDVNKMTVRNVGIVFAPTLNIPAPVFSMFLTDFDSIFGEMPDSSAETVELTVDRPLSSEDIRFPRHQMFSEIPTPAYDQTSFRNHDVPSHLSDPFKVYHDTGFISMKPSYEQQPSYIIERSCPNENSTQFVSMNRMLAPSADNSRLTKAKRRESFLLNTEANPRNPSGTNVCDDQVAEKSAI